MLYSRGSQTSDAVAQSRESLCILTFNRIFLIRDLIAAEGKASFGSTFDTISSGIDSRLTDALIDLNYLFENDRFDEVENYRDGFRTSGIHSFVPCWLIFAHAGEIEQVVHLEFEIQKNQNSLFGKRKVKGLKMQLKDLENELSNRYQFRNLEKTSGISRSFLNV